MLTPPQIRRGLRLAAAAAFRGDRPRLEEAAGWLATVPARELLRFDDHARSYRLDEPVLGESYEWNEHVLAQAPAAVALASMHRDGYVRQRAVELLVTLPGALSDRALAVRVTDHVRVIRDIATHEVLRRATPYHADSIVPLLHRIAGRGRGADVLPRYLRALAADEGEDAVWARLRASADHDLRRTAFRHSLDTGLLREADVIALFPKERDQVVRRMLVQIIADSPTPGVIAGVLLRGRAADGRALGLARLPATEIDPADLERLLADSSPLVRLWARRRWQELGRDAAATYAEIARSTAEPAVRARAYHGLAETGTLIEHGEIVDLVRSPEPALRKAGLSLLRGSATAAEVPLLFELVAGDHPPVARLAGEVLAESPRLWAVSDLGPLKSAERPDLRRRAWRIHRRLGGWETVIADLELLGDPDPSLAGEGLRAVPPKYGHPSPAQRDRVADLLAGAPLPRARLLVLAIAAGLPKPRSAIGRSG